MKVDFGCCNRPVVETLCRICGATALGPELVVTGAPVADGTLDLCRCTVCGSFTFAGDDPVIGYDFKGFSEGYWHHYVQSGAGIMAMLEPLLRLRPQAGGLLDVGCGFGFVPHFWQEAGLGAAVGLETSEYGRIGRQALGIDVRHSYYAPLSNRLDGRFRYVFTSEVLEHVPDPRAFLTEIAGGLTADGILILTTPAAEGVDPASEHTDLLAALSPGFHYFIASEAALAHLLRQCGFAHVRVENAGHRLFAWASQVPLPDLAPVGEGWERYLSYLDRLSAVPDAHVVGGALYRLFKDRLNTGEIEVAARLWDRLASHTRDTYGLDLKAGLTGAPATSLPAEGIRAFPDFSLSPSWLGCALWFGAKLSHLQGAVGETLVPMLCRAVDLMGCDLEDLSQFAQEPAHFLPQARELLAQCLAQAGGGATCAPGSDDPAIRVAAELRQVGQARRAESILWQGLAQAVKTDRGRRAEAAFWTALADLAREEGDAPSECICREAAAARAPHDTAVQVALGRFAAAQGRHRRAYAAFRLATNVEPFRAALWADLAAAALALTCYRLARDHAARALHHDPRHAGARLTMARAELAIGRAAVAQAILAPLGATAQSAEAHLLQIGAAIQQGEVQTALYDLGSLAEQAPDDATLRQEFLTAFRQSGFGQPTLDLLEGLNLKTWHHGPVRAPARAPTTCDVIVLAGEEANSLRACIDSLSHHGRGWIGAVRIAGSVRRSALANLADLPFPLHLDETVEEATNACTAPAVLLIAAATALLPDTLPALFNALADWPDATLAAALPLSGPMSAHPQPPDRQAAEPLPDTSMACALRDHLANHPDASTSVPVPVVPPGCLLFRTPSLSRLLPVMPGTVAGIFIDLCLRLADADGVSVVALDAPLSIRTPLHPPNWAGLYDRHSALRVLSAMALFDAVRPVEELRMRLAEDMALHLPELPPDRPLPVAVRPPSDGIRMRWLTAAMGPLRQDEEICLFVAFAPDGVLPPLTITQIVALRAGGLRVVLCVNVLDTEAPVDPGLVHQADDVVLRDNAGYDFAAWADIMRSRPVLWQAGLLLFANDSMVTLTAGIPSLLCRIRRSSGDFIALTDSRMHRRHVQSYLFAYRSIALAAEPVQAFWQGVEVLHDKQEVIHRYEFALLDLAERQAGLRTEILYPLTELLGTDRRRLMAISPTHHLWRQLLLRGFPFVKAELLRAPPAGVRASDVLLALEARDQDTEIIQLHLEETTLNRLPLNV